MSGESGRVDKRRLRARFYIVVFLADLLALVVGYLLSGWLRFGLPATPQSLSLLAATVPLFFALELRAFTPESLVRWREGAMAAVMSLFFALLMVMFIAFYLKAAAGMSRAFTLSAFVTSAILLVLARAIIGAAGQRAFGTSARSRLLITDGVTMAPPPGVQLFRVDDFKLTSAAPHPLVLDRLARALRGVDDAYVACPVERREAWATAMKGSGVRAELLMPELDSIGAIGNEHFAGVATVLVSAGALTWRDQVTKRALDLAIAVPALLFLAPLLLVVALAIKLDTRGPVFFVQQRVGFGNRMFPMFKFRSMHTNLADQAGATSASRGDPRVTRIGRFIRATSIDELPQLLNILRGEMSFVGPRPHALGSLAGNQLFWEVDHRYHHRHACKPGLTGLAQVRGFRGATHRREDLVNRLDADLEYVNRWSVNRDLLILLATVRVVVHRNAF